MSVAQEFKTTKELVLYILENSPETRSSDNKLYIKCAEHLGAKTLDDLQEIKLNLVSVHKLRQQIQNKEGMYLPDEKVTEMRKNRRVEIREFMKKAN
jgi:hypothetical protein